MSKCLASKLSVEISSADVAPALEFLQNTSKDIGIDDFKSDQYLAIFDFFGWEIKQSKTGQSVLNSPSRSSKADTKNFRPTPEKYRSLLHALLLSIIYAADEKGDRILQKLAQQIPASGAALQQRIESLRGLYRQHPNTALLETLIQALSLDVFQYRDNLAAGQLQFDSMHLALVDFLIKQFPALDVSDWRFSSSSRQPTSPTNHGSSTVIKPASSQSRVVDLLGTQSFYTLTADTPFLQSVLAVYNQHNASLQPWTSARFLQMDRVARRPVLEWLQDHYEREVAAACAADKSARTNFNAAWIADAWTRTQPLLPVVASTASSSSLSSLSSSPVSASCSQAVIDLIRQHVPEFATHKPLEISILADALNLVFRLDGGGLVVSALAESSKAPVAAAIDHWIPLAKGGLTVPDNCVILHWRLNGKKSGKLPHFVDLQRLASDMLNATPRLDSESTRAANDEKGGAVCGDDDDKDDDDNVDEKKESSKSRRSSASINTSGSSMMAYDAPRLLRALCETPPQCLLGFPANLDLERAPPASWSAQHVAAVHTVQLCFAPVLLQRLADRSLQRLQSMRLEVRLGSVATQMHTALQQQVERWQAVAAAAASARQAEETPWWSPLAKCFPCLPCFAVS